MKIVMGLIFTLMVSSIAFAEGLDFWGQIVSSPASVKVIAADGTLKAYPLDLETAGLTSATTGSSLTMFKTGTKQLCVVPLGLLAEDFQVVLEPQYDGRKSFNVPASNKLGRDVYVYSCPSGSTLESVQLSVKGSAPLYKSQ